MNLGHGTLQVAVVVAFFVVNSEAQNGCFNRGIFLPNGTVWHHDPCSQCQCHSGVIVCNAVECQVPTCERDQSLISFSHECCPKCLPKLLSCLEGRDEYKHGATWSLPPCLECQCYNGTVSCERIQCHIIGCPVGQVAVQSVGDCCPHCVPTGRSCRVGSSTFEDGEIWSHVPCTKCQCQNGLVQCFVAQCQSLSCPLNHTLEVMSGDCCPSCQGYACSKDGQEHKSGESWTEGSCTHCSCTAGRINCYQITCPEIPCPVGQVESQRAGSCCPSCVQKKGWCVVESGLKVPHGTQVRPPISECNTEKNLICYCHHGKVECSDVTCQRTNCGLGMKLKTEWGSDLVSCRCPKCVPDLQLCYYERQPKKDGEVWSVGCRLCECREGKISCYTPACPTCAEGFSIPIISHEVSAPAPLPPSGAFSCCPECLPASCPDECVACSPVLGDQGTQALSNHSPAVSNASHHAVMCTSCRKPLFLQDGRCVMACSSSTYAVNGRCRSCHLSCFTCTGRTRFQCTSCPPSSFLRGGECVADCGQGFYGSHGKCRPCHPSCQECFGASATECLMCQHGAKLLNGSCLAECPQNYVARNSVCENCPESCLRCGISECLTCKPQYWHQDGKCLQKCQQGYYETNSKECHECHPTCLTCSDSGIASCSTCPGHLLQLGTYCVSVCPPATFQRGNVCVNCHASCGQCVLEGETGCLKCKDKNKYVVGDFQSHTKKNRETHRLSSRLGFSLQGMDSKLFVGRCIDECPDGHKVHDGKCLKNPENCENWHQQYPEFCDLCQTGYVNEGGKCLSTCSLGFFKAGDYCLECSPHCATCSSDGSSSCDSCAQWGSLHQSSTSGKDSSRNSSRCLTKCPKGHYLNLKDMSCRMCDSSCKDCATPSTSGAPVCVKCRLADDIPEGSKCVSSCSEGYYNSKTSKHCEMCHFSCKTCFGPSPHQCLSCQEDHDLTKEKTCETSKCAKGTSSEDGMCNTNCDEDCQSCSKDDKSVCTTCPLGKHLLYGKCIDKCPKMFYSDSSDNGNCKECHWACDECLGPSAEDCIHCGNGRLRQGNRCVAKCSDSFYEHEGTCKSCPGGCKKCVSNESCSSCQPPYFLEKNQCVPECATSYYPNVWENKCVACETNCRLCSIYECQKCANPFVSQSGACVSKCGENFYLDKDNMKCHHNSESPQLLVVGAVFAEYEGPVILNSSIIHVFDQDTEKDRISIVIEKLPTNGDLFKINPDNDRTKIKINDKIPYVLFEEGRLIFVYKRHRPFDGILKISISDGQLKSETRSIPVNVVSRFSPEILVLEPLIVRRGGKSTITSDNLKLRDVDSPEVVVIQSLHGPSSGRLTVFGKERDRFSIEQLEELQVTYEHSQEAPMFDDKRKSNPELNLNENSDSILFLVTDGYNTMNFLFSIVIVNSSNSSPIVVKNKGAKVVNHQRVQITKDLLQAKDVDSVDENIVYSISSATLNTSKGKFVLVIPLPTTPNGFFNDGWIQMDESHLSRETISFTQRDINEGRVWYVYSAEAHGFPEGSSDFEAQYRDVTGAEYASDQIIFSVSDSSNPPNILGDQIFTVQVETTVEQETDTKMELTPGVQMGITVLEGQAVTITPSHLSFTGVNSNDHLVYIITRPLGPNDGSLFHIDSPGLELRQFTQSDINDMKIIYIPPLSDIGEEKVISFKFKISDEMKMKPINFPEQKFTIRILPSKEEMTFLHPNPELIVSSRGTIEIDTKYFQLSTMPEENITVFLLEAPRHGSLSVIAEDAGRPSEDFTEESETTLRTILSSRLLYSNDGSEASEDSAFILYLGHSSEATTRISFKIRLEDSLKPKPSKNASFFLNIKEEETKTITDNVLYFTDFHSDDEELVYTLSSQPMYGDLMINNAKGQTRILNQTHKLKQGDILNGKLSYSSNVEVGIEPVTDKLLFNVTDSNNNALTNQPEFRIIQCSSLASDWLKKFGRKREPGHGHYQTSLHVIDQCMRKLMKEMIHGVIISLLRIVINPVDNKSPTMNVLGQMEVEEGGTVVLTPDLLSFTDIDTPTSNLKLVIDIPPLFGYITNSQQRVSDSKYKSTSVALLMPEFTMQDIVDGKLQYIQSQHKHQEPTSDSFRVHLTDGTNSSPVKEIKIMIQPVNDETPVILGEQVSVERGGTITIRNVSLFISDSDTKADDIIITIEQTPNHGTLHKKKKITSSFKESVSLQKGEQFTFKDIVDELVFYSHDGSKVTEDEMEIIVSDGIQETGGLLEFLVLREEQKPPQMFINNPLLIQRGQIMIIRPSILSAIDEDSSNSDLMYVVTVPPDDGTLEKYDEEKTEWIPLSLGSNFLQKDINLGRIRYMNEKLKPDTTSDVIQFHVQDPEGNVLLDESLSILIKDDETPPRITVNEGLTLKELSFAVLTADVLSATDSEVDPMKLTFKIVKPPALGNMVFAADQDTPTKTWTQNDIELGSVGYRHLKESKTLKDDFKFEVSDGTNSVTQLFAIEITIVDEIPPYLLLKTLKVQEGTRKNISQHEIQAKDPDTDDEHLTFKIHKSPQWGSIQKISDGAKSVDVMTFTMQDVYEGRISYIHRGDSKKNDSFSLTVSDPYNKGYLYQENESPISIPSTLDVVMLSVSSGTPIIALNRGIQYLQHIDGKAQNSITSLELNIKDEDSSPVQLVYKVTQPPQHGVLRLKTHSRPVSTFTQAMINEGNLYYELTNFNEEFINDKFIFEVMDQSSNRVPSNVFLIKWSWIYMTKKEYNIKEADGVVQIFIKRSGNLAHLSSVECSLVGSSRRNGKLFKKRKSDRNIPKRDKKDYVPLSLTADFGVGSMEKFCEIAIIDDDILEGNETFTVKLSNAKYSLIGKPKKSTITISDEEDRPSLSFDSGHYTIEESEGFIFVPIKRTGDIQVPASVSCVTKDLSAIGVKNSNMTGDYVIKTPQQTSRVVFPPGVKLSTCDVKLIDDINFELDETFELLLVDPSSGVVIGDKNKTFIKIKGPNDQSVLSFKNKNYEVVESSGKIRITIKRTGSDLDHYASVWCASKVFAPVEAQPNSDFIPFSKQIIFEPGQDEAMFSINIIDDKGNPRFESPENFVVFLSTPQNATLNHELAEVNITIRDDEDIPTIQFESPEVKVNENDTVVSVPVKRTGDLSKPSSVYCFTRQRSAKGGIDFIERPNTKDSIIKFPIGVSKVYCEVSLLDDLVYEKQEDFVLKLSVLKSPFEESYALGSNRVSKITIFDYEDKPRVSFEKLSYSVTEPASIAEKTLLQIPIIRTGDHTKSIKIFVSTKDGSAASAVNYIYFHRLVNFPPGIVRKEITLQLIHEPSRQWNKTFGLILGPKNPINGELGSIISTAITIIDHHVNEASVLPSVPVVVSLLHYDNAAEHIEEPASPGYPLICITSCEEQHPEYSRTRQLCEQAGFDRNSDMKYSWEVAVPSEEEDLLAPFHVLTESTLFGNSSSKVLDSMFFTRQFRVRCIVQPVIEGGHTGIPLKSRPISVSSSNAICEQPGINTRLQGQTFIAKLSYVNFTDGDHPNTVEINVKIPHQDGMLPLISTLPLHNIRYLLTDNLYRAHHTCSNLHPSFGFFDSQDVSDNFTLGESRPYQWDETMRENNTLNLYRHLNLRTCTWTFTAYYSMSQLVEECGGQIVSDFQLGSAGQSFLTVKVPLYLSYTYASPAPGWTSLDHRTELSVSLYYSTLLWNQGLHTEPSLTAKIQISRLYLNSAGALVIEWSTTSKFRGQFVLNHSMMPEEKSALISPPNLNLNFSLELLWSAATWDGPEQVWRATSQHALKDYTGEYILQLIPCTVFPAQSYEYSDTPRCIPQRPVNFTLPISIQQIQRPVPLIYSLNTNFQLFQDKEKFLLDPREVRNLEAIDYKGRFGPSQTVYGRVLWHPNQDLNSAYQLIIQRVFLCTGNDGYIPKYDPTGDVYDEGPQFGCIQPSKNLRHRFLILDREVPYITVSNSTPVEAFFAEDFPELDVLKSYPGVDGFLLKTDGLYKMNSGYQWFLQVLYTIGPSKGNRQKRDGSINDTITTDRYISPFLSSKFLLNESDFINMDDIKISNTYNSQTLETLPAPSPLLDLHTRNGTNMRRFTLSVDNTTLPNNTYKKSVLTSVLYVFLALLFIAIVGIVVILLVKRHYNKQGREKVIVVRSLKNEREVDRRKEEFRVKSIRPSGSPVTLNSESNLQTIKVKTLAVTVRNNLEEDGTEV